MRCNFYIGAAITHIILVEVYKMLKMRKKLLEYKFNIWYDISRICQKEGAEI